MVKICWPKASFFLSVCFPLLLILIWFTKYSSLFIRKHRLCSKWQTKVHFIHFCTLIRLLLLYSCFEVHAEDFRAGASKTHFILHFTPCCSVSYMLFKRFISYNFQFSFHLKHFSVHGVRSWYFTNDHFEFQSPIISGFVLLVFPLSIHSH